MIFQALQFIKHNEFIARPPRQNNTQNLTAKTSKENENVKQNTGALFNIFTNLIKLG